MLCDAPRKAGPVVLGSGVRNYVHLAEGWAVLNIGHDSRDGDPVGVDFLAPHPPPPDHGQEQGSLRQHLLSRGSPLGWDAATVSRLCRSPSKGLTGKGREREGGERTDQAAWRRLSWALGWPLSL